MEIVYKSKKDFVKVFILILGGHKMPQQFYSVRQLAEVLNVSYLTAFRQIIEKKIPSVRLGRKILVPITYVENLLNKAELKSLEA